MVEKKIGLLGGSFNPAHSGHVQITLTGLKCFYLDEIWWLVSPGNPLKKNQPAPLGTRIKRASKIMDHPRVRITNIESKLSFSHTIDTVSYLKTYFPRKKFVWLMGADNLQEIDRWKNWHQIMHTLPVGVFARPGDQLVQLKARAARIYKSSRIPMSHSRRLADRLAPCWCYVTLPMNNLSSTELRKN